MSALKLGKQPARHDPRDLLLEHYLTPVLPKVPAAFGHEGAITDWQMLGNDSYGDCVFAGAAHETMLWNAEGGRAVGFTDSAVLADYAAVTGFDPADPSTDRGTDVRQALSYRRKTGVVDANGKRHKIGAFVALEPGNYEHLLTALYLFGAVGIGIQFPVSAMDQFNRGRPWSVVSGASIDGGHYIPLVARRHRHLDCVSWGRVQPMTKGFYERYTDESYALLSPEMLAAGHSPEGFDLAALTADLRAL